MRTLPVSLAVEGLLDEQVTRQLLSQSNGIFIPGVCYGKQGREHLAQNLPRFNQAAKFHPFVVVADLEADDCAPGLIRNWLPSGRQPNLVLRIAVRKIEAWLLADREAIADYLGVALSKIPLEPDNVPDPKVAVINLARSSRLRSIRTDLPPRAGATSQVGKNYLGVMTQFVLNEWQAQRASNNSPSLLRAITALQNLLER